MPFSSNSYFQKLCFLFFVLEITYTTNEKKLIRNNWNKIKKVFIVVVIVVVFTDFSLSSQTGMKNILILMDCISKSGQISLCYELSPVDFFSIYLSFSLHLSLFASLVFRFKRKFYPFIWILMNNEKVTFAHKTENQ